MANPAAKSPESVLIRNREWWAKNKDKRNETRRNNPLLLEHARKAMQERRSNPATKEKYKQTRKRFEERVWQEWFLYLKQHDLMRCKFCGFDKCFAAIDYHHIDAKEKKASMHSLFTCSITSERIKELEKTIPLCANCHRELHHGIKEGRSNE